MTISKTKRHMLPRVVKVPRKEYFWGTSAIAGKHNTKSSVPLLHVLRDYLHLGDKEREITRILNAGMVLIDGRKVKERRTSVGFMDLISVVPNNEHFRIVYDKKGRLVPKKEIERFSSTKFLKVEGKNTIRGGKTQIVLHDGQNFISSQDLVPGDVIVAKLPEKSIEEVLKMQPGSKVYITGGSHIGETATIKKIEVKKSSSANLVEMEEGFETVSDYVFVIGTQRFSYDFEEAAA